MKGKTALITGAGRGIGRAAAVALAQAGANVVINYAGNETTALETEKLCKKAGAETFLIKGNVEKAQDCAKMVEETVKRFGRIDILVNNAGIYPACRYDEYSPELFQKVNNLNVLGTFMVIKSAVKIMEKQRKGVILNTSSMAGIDGAMGNIGYTASKFGVEGLTLGLARELGPKGIRVNGVAPAGIDRTDLDGNIIISNVKLSDEEVINRLKEKLRQQDETYTAVIQVDHSYVL